ncbi:MAG: AAA family ATPase [Rudaea sp.]|nr:AAA family ATPase [Rudaea sp.]
MDIVFLLIGAGLGWLLARVSRAQTVSAAPTPQAPAGAPAQEEAANGASDAPAGSPNLDGAATVAAGSAPDPRARANGLARELAQFCESADQGDDLEHEPRFNELRAILSTAPFTPQDRLNLVTSQNIAMSCAGLAAMAAVGDESQLGVARVLARMGYMALHFILRYLGEAKDPKVCATVLLRAQRWWTEHPPTRAAFVALLDRQHGLDIHPVVGEVPDGGDWDLDERSEVLGAISHPLVNDFLEALKRADRVRSGEREVLRVGRALPAEEEEPFAENEATHERIQALTQTLLRPGKPSLVLVGPDGVGKTTLARAALRELVKQGWRIIEATPAQMMAGQKYIGELEQRIENFVHGLGSGRAMWFVPDCHQLLEAGTWSQNPHGILDHLLPYIERGALQILGESTAVAWTRVIAQRPRVEVLIAALRVEPMTDAEALALVRDWSLKWQNKLGREVISDAVASEACELSRQQFPERPEPGRSLDLLKEALAAAQRTQPPTLPIDRDQLLATLARSSGLPLEILDIGRMLDVAAIRSYFLQCVIGQEEAVDCLVDRISMLKAGLTDSRRPIGVFLFAGPTGTGKTEIAKTLARFLFGSPDRMLRFDMSEYQSDDAYWRLIDDGEKGRATSLTTRIRQHPFSVILLDEFEKASARIWDLFLQVFDDGRLTDRSGNTADFRHSIIILTSNLGSTISTGVGMGFVGQRGAFSRELVQRAIDTTFRREFVNRLDRVVVFNPLTRALMRDILEKELRSVLERRGFRGRNWAVEWEPSAIEFLLEKGFTPDLGARPLRRAIDQYLLAPLARTMVEHRVPKGEQFLFVQGEEDSLRVRFVDPDETAVDAPAAAARDSSDLRTLALEPRLDDTTLAVLQREIDARSEKLEEPVWLELKEEAVQAMQRSDFWQQPERQQVLDRLERMDRIESGLRSANSLYARLSRGAGRSAAEFVRRLVLLVMAIDSAIGAIKNNEAEGAQIEIIPADIRTASALEWRDRIADMYVSWAQARGMRIRRRGPNAASGALHLDVSGFGAYQTLRSEQGLHVLESRLGETEVRHSVRVSVSPDSVSPVPPTQTDSESRVCRRYTDGPSPLVRDSVRGWRSGRLDRVLAGDFDLLSAASE